MRHRSNKKDSSSMCRHCMKWKTYCKIQIVFTTNKKIKGLDQIENALMHNKAMILFETSHPDK